MKKRCTTTGKILETALEIAKKEGVDKLNIRKIAADCGIAVGSVYNYYPNKDALMSAVAEAFWNDIFSEQEQLYRLHSGFTGFLEQYYGYLYARLSSYDRSWLRELKEKIPMEEPIELLQKILSEDENVNPSIWNMEFQQENFCRYVFQNILALLQSGETNCRFFIYLLDNLLYEK